MKKELMVQGLVLGAAIILVLIAFLALRDDAPVEVHDEALAEWLRETPGGAGDYETRGPEPIQQMTPSPGMETVYD